MAVVEDAFDSFKPDFVFVRNAWSLSRRAARAARRRGVPALLYNQLPVIQNTSVLRQAELLWKGLPRRRVTPVAGLPPQVGHDPWAMYLPWPVAALPSPDPMPKPKGKLHLVCVGKLGLPRKNQPLLIKAMEAAGLQSLYHLTLIGTAPKEHKPGQYEQAQLMADLSTRDWITMHPNVPFPQMGNIHASADVSILPSFAEPLGTSPIEAMAYGSVPVISSDCGSAGYLTDGQNGFVIDMTRPDSATNALRKLATDDAMRQRMSQAARQTAETELSEARFIERLNALLMAHGVT
ncbi:glycosyltransferase family 4 protein [Primorskyibacter sp. 2E233]|uniref:glycosyltransferase family 4 protein n=1 Tax=Primorskyibacter sp. 2E233 TaxID=3413431 RepID=UPI003BF241FA